MTVSEYIFDFLQKKGIDTVYMVSGSSAMWLTDSLYKNEKLKAICTHHEQAAVMAADLYGRTRNKPGVALVTIGPGATNAITGVAEAYVDSSPLFVISGQANSKLLSYEQKTGIRQHGTQSLNLEPIVSSITKYFAVISTPEDVGYYMEKAWYESTTGRRGPVWIDVPVDIQNKQIPDKIRSFDIPLCNEEKLVISDEILKKFKNSKCPMILAGAGVSKDNLEKLIEKYHIPVVTSRMGIDRIESDSPFFVGRIGAYGQRAAHFSIQQSDFLLILGCRLSVSTIGYYPERFAENAFKVQVDIDSKELDKTDVPINIKIKMKTEDFINDFIKIEEYEINDKWTGYCNELKDKYPVVEDKYRVSDPLNAYYFTEILSKITPTNSTVVVDTGSVCNIVSQTWHIKEGQKYLISGGLSCMGFWVGAIGCCDDSQTVCALSGDGSVSMNIQEFATLSHNKLPIKLFVYNNNGYLLIKHNQHNYMNDRFLGVSPESGVQTPDFCKVAEAYNINCIRISYGDNVEEKIKQVFETEGPVVCEIMLEPFGVLAPRIASKVMPDGSLKAAEFDDLAPFLEEDEKPELYK